MRSATLPGSKSPTYSFSNSDVGSSTSHKNKSVKVLWDGTYCFSSLSEKNRKSNHLQILLPRQHFLLSYLKTLSVGQAGVWTPSWANQAAVILHHYSYDHTQPPHSIITVKWYKSYPLVAFASFTSPIFFVIKCIVILKKLKSSKPEALT